MSSGIYRIINLVDNKIYIGSAQDIDRRIKIHKGFLSKNKHYNKHLQHAWNKYGIENFKFEILELVDFIDRKILREIEQSYLNDLDYTNSYNISKYADGGLTGPPLRGEKHINHRKISVYDKNMNFIEEIGGLREAERKYKSHAIYESCKGKISNTVGFIFKYSDEYIEYKPKQRKRHTLNPLQCYDLDGNLIIESANIFSMSKELKICRGHIKKRLNKILIKGSKYNFKFKQDGVFGS